MSEFEILHRLHRRRPYSTPSPWFVMARGAHLAHWFGCFCYGCWMMWGVSIRVEGLPGGRCRELSCPLTIYMAHRLCFVYIVLNFLRYKYRLHPGVLIEDVYPTRTCTLAYLKDIAAKEIIEMFINYSKF